MTFIEGRVSFPVLLLPFALDLEPLPSLRTTRNRTIKSATDATTCPLGHLGAGMEFTYTTIALICNVLNNTQWALTAAVYPHRTRACHVYSIYVAAIVGPPLQHH